MSKHRYKLSDQERFCGLGFLYPKHEQNVAIAFRSAVAMGLADFLFTVGPCQYVRPQADTIDSYKLKPCWQFDDVMEMVKKRPLCTELVAVELTDDAVPIEEFEHPKRALYLLGNERDGFGDNIRHFKKRVKLPSIGVSMNVAIASSVILYDRYMKERKDV